MRIPRAAHVFGLFLAMALPACGSVLQAPDAGSDSGTDTIHDGGGGACQQLNEAACRARTDCAVGMCAGICGQGAAFAGCYDPARETPPPCVGFGAPGAACPAPCSALTDEASCATRSDCRANYCPTCRGDTSFSGCVPATTGANACPAIACPVACSTNTTQATCDARPDCHSVFVDPGNCRCAGVGCCARFSRCADGKAICTPPPSIACMIATPCCEAPAYVVSYAGGCYEGCVAAAACSVN